MAELPQISGHKAVRAFERAGFEQDRQSGSHAILKKEGFAFVLSVPLHDELKKGTLRKLIKVSGLTVEEFRGHL